MKMKMASELDEPFDERELLSPLVSAVCDLVMVLDRGYRIRQVYGSMAVPVADALIGKFLYQLAVAEEWDATRGYLDRALLKGEPVEFEARGFTPDGQMSAVRHNAAPLLRDGKIVGLVFTAKVIDRQKASMAFSLEDRDRREAFFRQVIDLAPVWIYVRSIAGTFLLVNQRVAATMGLAPGQMEGKSIDHLLSLSALTPEQVERYRKEDIQVIETKRPMLIPRSETTLPDGSIRVGMVTKVPLEIEGHGTCVLGVGVDITDQITAEEALRKAEEKARQTDRLAFMGVFAAGIAHEINNPLASILSCARFAQVQPGKNEQALNDIAEQAKRCGRIISTVLRFAHSQPSEKWQIDLNACIEKGLSYVRALANSREVKLRLDLPPAPSLMNGNGLEVEQAVANVVKNAIEASAPGSIVEVKSFRHETGLCISIQDYGEGMGDEQLAQALVPFYSTRLHEGGTGLGLSVVHAILRDHGATLRFQSRPGSGTTATMVFPSSL